MLPNGILRLLLLLACTIIALPALSATSLSASAKAQLIIVDHKDSDQSDIVAGISCTSASIFKDHRQRAQWVPDGVVPPAEDPIRLQAEANAVARHVPGPYSSPLLASRTASWKNTNLLYQQLSIAG